MKVFNFKAVAAYRSFSSKRVSKPLA